jgi:hypothetical protein
LSGGLWHRAGAHVQPKPFTLKDAKIHAVITSVAILHHGKTEIRWRQPTPKQLFQRGYSGGPGSHPSRII